MSKLTPFNLIAIPGAMLGGMYSGLFLCRVLGVY